MGLLSVSVDTPVATQTTDFEHLFQVHYPRIWRLVAGLLGVDEADDIAQEVFLRLYHGGANRPSDERLGGWLARVAINLATNQRRAQRRQANHLARAGQLDLIDQSSRQAELDPVRRLAASEEAALVRAALAALPSQARTLLILRQSGFSYAEVASAVGLKPSSIGTLLARAEAQLRQRYQQLAGAPTAGSPSTGGRP